MPPAPRTLGAGPCTGALVLFLALLALAACAAQPGGTDAGGSSGSGTGGEISRPDSELTIELDRGDGSPVERYTLVCAGAAEGSHPAAQAACDHLSGMDDPFAPLAADLICAQVFSGPETAHVTGRWQGRPVDLQLARNDACHTTQWDGLGPLLPA